MTERVQRFFAVQAEQDSELGPRQVRLRASTEALGRDGLVVVTRGIDLEPYRTNPVMLWQHKREEPVARAVEVSTAGGDLQVLAEFAEQGTSERADEICSLVKQGIVSGISCGFDIFDAEPIDPKHRSAGRRITKSELLEISFVTVPAERNSLVTERADGEGEAEEPLVEHLTIKPFHDPVWIGEERAAEFAVERAGAKHSAATRSKMAECSAHIDNAMRCLREMMDGDEMRDMDEGGEDMRSYAGVDGAAADGSLARATIKETFPWGTEEQRGAAAERFRRQLALRTRAA